MPTQMTVRSKYIPWMKLPVGMNFGHYPETKQVIMQSGNNYTINRSLLAQWGTPLFPVLRFMDWQKTNREGEDHAKPVSWDDLPQVSDNWDYKSGPWSNFHGVPLRICVEVANVCKASPWICIPDTASDELVEKMIKYVIEHAEHRPIFEHSNEMWNAQFKQYQRGVDEGAGLADDPFRAALYWHTARTAFISERVGDDGYVVLGGWARNSWATEQMLSYLYNDLGGRVDAFAIAPYFGNKVVFTEGMTEDELFSELHQEIDVTLRQLCQDHYTLCEQYGVELWGYEGGQHLNPPAHAEQLCANLNGSPRMGELINDWLKMWFEVGGELICPYSLVSNHSGNQYWGHLDGSSAHYSQSAKFTALLDTIHLPLYDRVPQYDLLSLAV